MTRTVTNINLQCHSQQPIDALLGENHEENQEILNLANDWIQSIVHDNAHRRLVVLHDHDISIFNQATESEYSPVRLRD